MSLILDGTNGLSDIDGSAATPAIRGTDANTGIFFPAADTIAFATAGTEDMRLDAFGTLGLGVTPSAWSGVYKAIQVGSTAVFGGNTSANRNYSSSNVYWNGSNYKYITTSQATQFEQSDGAYYWLQAASGTAGNNITFTQAMTLDSSGNLLVGTTNANLAGRSVNSRMSVVQAGGDSMTLQQPSNNYLNIISHVNTTSGTRYHIGFGDGTTYGERGVISTNGSSTTYSTSSDYRLKNSIAPMIGALAKVALLKPCTYKWNTDGSDGEGFIAHELQAIIPSAVTGEKDSVDENGNPKYQGIDTSFLVATLTAAIQEQQALITQLQADVAALKASA
jgi:hypothetical protein